MDSFVYQPEPGWQLEKTQELYHSPHLQVFQETVKTPRRPEGGVQWLVAKRKSAVIIAPILPDGRFLMIRQERVPVKQLLWEFPAGQVDDMARQDDMPYLLETALRELEEETQHVSSDGIQGLDSLGYFLTSPGFTNERGYLFIAHNVVPLKNENTPLGIGNELITQTQAFTLDELRGMVADNIIQDANSLAILARLWSLN
jgi:8-oxo-dGTP pyrophosphatase MutT (NUDIX family)